MTILKRNIFSNVLGKVWSTAIGLVFIPVYLRLLGAEAFGLVAFFTMLLSTIQILEFGLGTTINRELARFSIDHGNARQARDLSRTLEVIYYLVAICIGSAIVLAAPLLADQWLHIQTLPVDEATVAVAEMGVAIALLWPCSFYNNGLIGLERQALQNIVGAVLSTIRAVGAVCTLLFIERNVQAFFLWQIVFGSFQLAVLAYCFWRYIPQSPGWSKFRFSQLRRVGRFTAGMGATGIVTFILSQLDKVLLSSMLPLAMFAYYSLANQINNASRILPAALYAAFFPRFSALIAQGDEAQLRRLYHQGCQLVSLAVFPAAMTGAFYAPEILRIWSGSPDIAEKAGIIASVLLLGSAINSVMGLPYDVTLARGRTSIGFYQNLISAIVVGPAIVLMVNAYGGLGAAYVWLFLNISYLLIAAPIIHAMVLPGELMKWYLTDVGRPFVVSVAVSVLAKLLLPSAVSMWLVIASGVLTWAASMIFCAAVLPEMRGYLLRKIGEVIGTFGSREAR